MSDQSSRVTFLEWDSEFFGVPIGRVALDDADAEALGAIDDEARDLGIACLFGSLTPGAEDSSLLAQRHGHDLVEIALKFRRPEGPFEARPTDSVCRVGTVEDVTALGESIDTLAPWSRFAVDPRFGQEAARRMHRAWVERAAREEGERLLLIAEDDAGATGVSTSVRSPVPCVDLMGVIRQGSGASWAMMQRLVDWAGGGGAFEAGPCAARNVAVLRFLEHCGFAVCATEYRYHRWLDDTSRAAW